MVNFLLILKTAIHLKPSQIFYRLRLALKRRVAVRLTRLGLPRGITSNLKLDSFPCQNLPSPLFLPRTKLVYYTQKGLHAHIVKTSIPLRAPVEWHPPQWVNGARLEMLVLHYMEYLEAMPDWLFKELVLDWIASNPPFQEHYWLRGWNSYALSIRAVVWMQQYQARWQGIAKDHDFAHVLTHSLVAQLRFLEKNLEMDLGGNHLLKNIKALLWAARFFSPSAFAQRVGRLGRRLLAQALKEQILADGFHFERSPSYHCQVFADLLECRSVLPQGALAESLQVKLEAMAQVVADMTHPDGEVALFNDSGLHMTYSPVQCLKVYRAQGGRTSSQRRVFALNQAGYFGLRGERVYFVADCGDIGPDYLTAHGHGDMLSFELSVDGLRMVVDPGVYEYIPGQRRQYSRSTASHNTMNLDGRNQCDFWSSHRTSRLAHARLLEYQAGDDGFFLVGSHDGYEHLAGSPRPIREFEVSSRHITVRDQVQGGRGQRATANLLFHPACRLTLFEGGAVIQRDDVRLRVRATGKLTLTPAYWHPDFGVEEPTQALSIDYGRVPCQGEFQLIW